MDAEVTSAFADVLALGQELGRLEAATAASDDDARVSGLLEQ